MKVKNEYMVCDRCGEEIKRHWLRQLSITKFKTRLFIGSHGIEEELDFCGKCEEKFERFMDMKIDDDLITTHERYYQSKEKGFIE